MGWNSWGEFLDTGRASKGSYMSFEDARLMVRKLKLKTLKEWREYSKIRRPKNIPSNPDKSYEQYWKGWADFLGK